MQKLLYLPEAHTDFILPVLGEELGFVGTSLVVLLFAGFVVCGLKIAVGTARRDRFGFLLAFGWVFCIGLQAAGNIAVVTGSVPTKGIALPFLSLGGSSLVVLCAALGLLYSVAARHDAEEFGFVVPPSGGSFESTAINDPAEAGTTNPCGVPA
jgi:cell division protein FtsW